MLSGFQICSTQITNSACEKEYYFIAPPCSFFSPSLVTLPICSSRVCSCGRLKYISPTVWNAFPALPPSSDGRTLFRTTFHAERRIDSIFDAYGKRHRFLGGRFRYPLKKSYRFENKDLKRSTYALLKMLTIHYVIFSMTVYCNIIFCRGAQNLRKTLVFYTIC